MLNKPNFKHLNFFFLFSTIILLSLIFLSSVNAKDKTFASTSKTAIDEIEDLKTFSHTPSWRRLLYYQSSNVSEIDNPKFFVSKKGKKSPTEEILESYRQMFLQATDPISDDHAICKFPARFLILNKQLKKNDFNKIRFCPKLMDFLGRANGQSMSLVFSSYHLNNPSSAFGHTFLKINKHDRKQFDLLNYGINYAATTDANNALLYALKGVLGFYKGEFTAIPYYYKIREYNDFESRDLWEYELNLTPEQMQLIILHFWELGRGWSWYYFLDGNCSYWALKVLQAISVDLNFDNALSANLIIPAETLKALNKYPNLIKEVYYRPSLRKQFTYGYNDLSKTEQKQVRQIAEKVFLQKITDPKSLNQFDINVLNSSLQFYDYKYADEYVKNEDETLKKKQPLLLARSTRSEKANETQILRPERPDKIHPPARLGIGYQRSDFFESYNINYKMGFHELYDSSVGMDSTMAINYFDLKLATYKLKALDSWRIGLEHLDLIRIDSLTPFSNFELAKSWRLRVGFTSGLFEKNIEQLTGYVQGDVGMAFAFSQSNLSLFYFMISNTLEANGRFDDAFRIGVAPVLGFKMNWNKNFITLLEGKHHWFYQTQGLWQRQVLLDMQTQWYLPSVKTAIYFKAMLLNLDQEDIHDHRLELGGRYFF